MDALQVKNVVPGMEEKDMVNLASLVYRKLITDRLVSPAYPPEALQSLLRDASLVEKWSLTQALRYGNLQVAGGALVALKAGTSSSTSCNGCSSCSTSVLPV